MGAYRYWKCVSKCPKGCKDMQEEEHVALIANPSTKKPVMWPTADPAGWGHSSIMALCPHPCVWSSYLFPCILCIISKWWKVGQENSGFTLLLSIMQKRFGLTGVINPPLGLFPWSERCNIVWEVRLHDSGGLGVGRCREWSYLCTQASVLKQEIEVVFSDSYGNAFQFNWGKALSIQRVSFHLSWHVFFLQESAWQGAQAEKVMPCVLRSP